VLIFRSMLQLETDEHLLIPKAQAALQRYGHQIVIGNDLNRRKFEVVFVERKTGATSMSDSSASLLSEHHFTETWVRLSDDDRKLNEERMKAGSDRRPEVDPVGHGIGKPWRGKYGEKEIEEDIIAELIRRHTVWIQAGDN
jgi:phosphopantothenate---cysteine ligase (ATP)